MGEKTNLLVKIPLFWRNKALELVGNYLTAKEWTQIIKYHTQLSIALGKPVGMLEREGKIQLILTILDEFDYMCWTDFTEDILKSMYK